jgi:hypothetical protein
MANDFVKQIPLESNHRKSRQKTRGLSFLVRVNDSQTKFRKIWIFQAE